MSPGCPWGSRSLRTRGSPLSKSVATPKPRGCDFPYGSVEAPITKATPSLREDGVGGELRPWCEDPHPDSSNINIKTAAAGAGTTGTLIVTIKIRRGRCEASPRSPGPASLRSRAVLPQVMGARTALSGFVVWIQQVALVDREAAAADACRQAVAEGFQSLDAGVEVVAPLVREAFPVLPGRGTARREPRERGVDLGEGESSGAAGLDERDPPEHGSVVAALVAVGARGLDQALALVEPQSRRRDSAARRDLADRELTSHLT